MSADGSAPKAPDRSGLLPELRAMLEQLDSDPVVDIFTVAPADERASAEPRLAELWGEPEAVAKIEDLSFQSAGHAIPVRIYRPARARGTILFLHGGGWVVGSIATHDGSARLLANATPANVVSVEYRKAPEHPFPAGVIDVGAALDWLLATGPSLGLDASHIVLLGESAGATLAAVLARHARDRGVALAGQVLIYPPTDFSMSSKSYTDFASGYYLSADAMAWFIGHYMQDADRTHPDAAPIHATDLAGLAATYLATAGFDPLRDEGRAYAAKLIQAGNEVTYREWAGAVHGLWVMNAKTPATRTMIEDAAAWVRGRWTTS